ncbi:S-layer homology domain-containing protein [Paenibacillus taiwanensis]|uniref:S-layer homology domain-containing protein n=1 Tax=Paenibacillus taiwanensis TaxID=401638 RepID=UPI001FE01E68|nr:S-layer homology domain-containing protein [Paenibacillus taiwanensis]
MSLHKLISKVLLFSILVTTITPLTTVQAATGPNVTEGQVQGEYALNLTQAGDVDWLHLRGDNLNKLSLVKKAGGQSVTFDVYGNTGVEGKTSRGSDANYMSYTWTDGMAGQEFGAKDTGFGLFFPSASREPGAYTNVGWNVQVEPQPTTSTLWFGVGMWQANVQFDIYTNDVLSASKVVSADATSKMVNYQVNVPANVKLRVEGRLTDVQKKNGNMSLSGVALSSKVLADKMTLQNEYNAVSYMTQGLYTDNTWQALITAKGEAKRILDWIEATQQDVDSAYQALLTAQSLLVKRESNIVIDYTGTATGEYTFGSTTDQQDRYQTFLVKDDVAMKYVQVNVKRNKEPVSNLVIKLYAVNQEGLPTGAPLASTIVNKDTIVDGGLTTAELSYSLAANTRYAIALTQEKLGSGQYRWMIMPKNMESANEFFGKTVSGVFKSEAALGTGIMRIVKEGNVNKAPLQTMIENVKHYNRNLFTLSTWSALETALSQADVQLRDVDVKQDTLDATLLQIQNAFNQLTLSKPLDEVAARIATLEQAVLKGYTSQSTAALQQAVQTATSLQAASSEQERMKAYSGVLNALDQLQLTDKYQYEINPLMTAGFGFEGDKNATLAFLDGSYQIGGTRPMQHGPVAPKQMVTFGATSSADIKWYNAEGYLPVFIHEFEKEQMKYKIESFANKQTVANKDYVINYSKMTVTNVSNETRLLPVVSENLVPMNAAAHNVYTIRPGETVIREYAIEADKYEYFDATKQTFTTLTREQVSRLGTFEQNYKDMKNYWNTRLSAVVDLKLPNKALVHAFKAGYIYNMIIKDGNYLHVGENGYARLYSHDTIGIFVQLIQSGDFAHAKEYLESIPLTGGINIETGQVDPNQFWDANWKLPWTYAVYLSKTGDASIFDEAMQADDGSIGSVFDKRVKFGAKSIVSDRAGDGHIMKETKAIDTLGYWTIDNYSALTGLSSYEYIARELYKVKGDAKYLTEAQWAKDQYDDLLAAFTAKLQATIKDKNLKYIPASVVQSNDENRMKDSRDANWASMFLFGRWLWDGYLYGAEQPDNNINLTMLDDTYSYGINRRINEGTTDSPYNFGGYPHGFYSSAYNAGYGSAALRGEAHRDMGIKAYEFMIEKSMSGPFSWWEGVNYPVNPSPWAPTSEKLGIQSTPGGGGSAQHMWGQAVNSKVLVDSLIAERIYEQNNKYELIIGRGIPKEWVKDAASNNDIVAAVNNYPAFQGGRVGYDILRKGNKLVVTMKTNLAQAKADTTHATFSIQLPSMVNNIKHASLGVVDNNKGIVTVPLTATSVSITLSDLPDGGNDNSGNNGNNGSGGNNSNNGNGTTTGNNAGNNENNNGNNGGKDGNTEQEQGSKQPTFSDISKHWAQEAINKAVAQGFIKGYENGTFRPNAVVTRGELTVMLARALKLPQADSVLSFKDEATIPLWAKSYITSAVQAGLIKGYNDQTFRPHDPMTRMELVVMIARALKLEDSKATLPFADSNQIPSWGKGAAAAVYGAGLLKGKDQLRLAPNESVTRAEAVTLLLRMTS